MGIINLIDSSIYNRISAGEVVERPVSVVKEFVENSIDAKATTISVYISNGAKNIRVVDDGCGICKEDCKLAFLPHATSKIKTADDLFGITTLGFRGEALASIASVSRVVLKSYSVDTGESTEIDVNGGVFGEVTESVITKGTDITVENLFYNTPVREKFLKSARAEEGEITNLLSRLILANPHIAFNYYLNGENKYQFKGDGLERAIYLIYGKNAIDNIYHVEGTVNGVTIDGYIGKHDYTKGNRTYQTLILNGRYVTNETVTVAMYRAYQPYLMKRAYPFFVLHATVDPNEVDVNVHPTKSDVRFSDTQSVFHAFYTVASDMLSGEIKEKSSWITEAKEDKKPFESIVPLSSNEVKPVPTADNIVVEPVPTVEKVENQPITRVETQVEIAPSIPVAPVYYNAPLETQTVTESVKEVAENSNKEEHSSTNSYFEIEKVTANESTYTPPKTYEIKGHKDVIGGVQKSAFDSRFIEEDNYDNFRIVGVFNKTYIIVENDNKMYMIDQHASHERILYDKYIASYGNQSVMVQDLLVPYIFDVNSAEEQFLISNISKLAVMGILIESYGNNSFQITSLPCDLIGMNMEKFIKELLSDLDGYQSLKTAELIKDRIAQTACKHAVKAGDELSTSEVKAVLHMMAVTEAVTCPHGRPLAIVFTKNDIEKMFKRIV